MGQGDQRDQWLRNFHKFRHPETSHAGQSDLILPNDSDPEVSAEKKS